VRRGGGGAGHEEHVILVGGGRAGVVGRSLGAGGTETCGKGIAC
jgi:hypothetical protein